MEGTSPQHVTTGFVIDLSAIVNTNVSNGHRTPIAGAKEALSALQEHNVPFAIVTRESRLSEKQVARGLEKQLGLHISSQSIVLPQTPFRDQVAEYKDKVIVLIGDDDDKAKQQAIKYGFEHVMTCKEIVQLYPHLYGEYDDAPAPNPSKLTGPFDDKLVEQQLSHNPAKPWISSRGDDTKVQAIFIWWTSSPSNWDRDISICIDLLLTKQGYIGTHTVSNMGYLTHWPHKQPQLFICKTETDAAHGHAVPRGRGGKTWLETLKARWLAKTGVTLEYVEFRHYDGAGCDKVMLDYADKVLHDANRRLHPDTHRGHPFPRTVYTIGQDVKFGAVSDEHKVLYDRAVRRRSIRVDPSRRGDRDSHGAVLEFHPLMRPWHVAGSLKEAVEYALAEEYWECVEGGLTPLWREPRDTIDLA